MTEFQFKRSWSTNLPQLTEPGLAGLFDFERSLPPEPPRLLADAMLGALTRDRRLTERRLARNHLLIRSDDVAEQLRQVLDELGLQPDPGRLLGRCLRCNTPLAPIDPELARARVPPGSPAPRSGSAPAPAAAASTGAAPTSGACWRGWTR